MEETVYRYSLRTPSGGWLGEVILTNRQEFFVLSDWGNFNHKWSSTGDIRKFILSIDEDYLAKKLFQGVSYQCDTEEMRGVCKTFAKEILPVLKESINSELGKVSRNEFSL